MGNIEQNLYRLVNGLGHYYVIAKDPTEAQTKLLAKLNAGDGYGFSGQRKVTEIHLVAEQITDGLTGLCKRFLLL